jgi:peptidoglycan/LPS O-acetylase OafA/YrhL
LIHQNARAGVSGSPEAPACFLEYGMKRLFRLFPLLAGLFALLGAWAAIASPEDDRINLVKQLTAAFPDI